MTVFSWIAVAVAVLLYWKLPGKGVDSFGGSVLLGFVWPVLVPMVPYYWVKRRLLRRESSPSVLRLEIIGFVVVGMGSLLAYLWWVDDPITRG